MKKLSPIMIFVTAWGWGIKPAMPLLAAARENVMLVPQAPQRVWSAPTN